MSAGYQVGAAKVEALRVSLGDYDALEGMNFANRRGALAHDAAMAVREVMERFDGVDTYLLRQEMSRAVDQYFKDRSLGPRTTAGDVLERLDAVQMFHSETGDALGSLAETITGSDAACIATAWDSRLDKQGSLSVEEQVDLALAVLNDDVDNRESFRMEVLGEVDTLEPDTVRVCTLDDERGALLILEPSGITMTRRQAIGLLQALGKGIGVLHDREANSLATRAGAWVAQHVSPEVKSADERNINVAVASRVEALAKECDLSDSELIQVIGCDADTFKRLMVGAAPWDFEQVGRIASRCGIDPFALITGAAK